LLNNPVFKRWVSLTVFERKVKVFVVSFGELPCMGCWQFFIFTFIFVFLFVLAIYTFGLICQKNFSGIYTFFGLNLPKFFREGDRVQNFIPLPKYKNRVHR